jgi:uncharacterized membrane protein
MAIQSSTTGSVAQQAPWIGLPGTILGIGLGGFVDGILLHQILQWHHMLTSTDTDNIGVQYYPADTVHGLQINTVWDGLFHTFTWLAVLIGLGLLYSRVTHSRGRVWTSQVLWGWILFGWGCSTSSKASLTTTCWASTTSAAVRTSSGGTSASWSSVPCW